MATYTKTVDPNGGADYLSLYAWEAAQQGLYSSGDVAVADCRNSGAGIDSGLTFSGWNAGVYAQIIGNPAYAPYKIWRSADYGHAIEIGNTPPTGGMLLKHLDIRGYGLNSRGIYWDVSSPFILNIDGCKIHACTLEGIRHGGGTLSLKNSIIYKNGGSGLKSFYNFGAPTASIDSCTVVGNAAYGINKISGTVSAINCYCGGNTTADYYGTITKTTCASSDSSGSAGLTGVLYSASSGAKFVNIGAGSEDYHLQSGSSLIGAGTYNASLLTDFDGITRANPPSIGPFEYVAAGGTTYTLNTRVSGAWSRKVAKVRLSGAWEDKPIKVRKSGAWVDA